MICRQEEQNALSSANYDVELLHCKSALDELFNSGDQSKFTGFVCCWITIDQLRRPFAVKITVKVSVCLSADSTLISFNLD